MEESQRKYSDLAPGLEQVIEAGDTLVMKDNEDNEFAVTAREHPDTLAFIKAFDDWLMVKNEGVLSMGVLGTLWSEVERTFRDLPMFVQRELSSFKKLGIAIVSHDH